MEERQTRFFGRPLQYELTEERRPRRSGLRAPCGGGGVRILPKAPFFEADRGSGSEALRVIEGKVIAYARLRQEGSYRTLGENVQGYRVLFVTTSEERARNIRRRIRGKPGDESRLGDGGDHYASNLLTGAICLDPEGKKRPLVRTDPDEQG